MTKAQVQSIVAFANNYNIYNRLLVASDNKDLVDVGSETCTAVFDDENSVLYAFRTNSNPLQMSQEIAYPFTLMIVDYDHIVSMQFDISLEEARNIETSSNFDKDAYEKIIALGASVRKVTGYQKITTRNENGEVVSVDSKQPNNNIPTLELGL